ncbi:hypothetical protein G9A89_023198 [Geosiphon pyriformis]|nr:hypothetical protein G9A89_023198 [Geosiphon pyriformis]
MCWAFWGTLLGDTLYFSSVHFLKHFGVAFGNKLLDKKRQTYQFLSDSGILSPDIVKSGQLYGLNILNFQEFSVVQSSLHKIWSSLFNGLLSSTLAELQAIALALKCVPFFCTVVLYTDSQAVIDACVSEMSSVVPDFHAPSWIKRCYIFNLIYEKNINVKWIKIRSYSGIYGNEKTNAAAGDATCSQFSLSVGVQECFLVAENMVVSNNAQHFVRNLYRFVCYAH